MCVHMDVSHSTLSPLMSQRGGGGGASGRGCSAKSAPLWWLAGMQRPAAELLRSNNKHRSASSGRTVHSKTSKDRSHIAEMMHDLSGGEARGDKPSSRYLVERVDFSVASFLLLILFDSFDCFLGIVSDS